MGNLATEVRRIKRQIARAVKDSDEDLEIKLRKQLYEYYRKPDYDIDDTVERDDDALVEADVEPNIATVTRRLQHKMARARRNGDFKEENRLREELYNWAKKVKKDGYDEEKIMCSIATEARRIRRQIARAVKEGDEDLEIKLRKQLYEYHRQPDNNSATTNVDIRRNIATVTRSLLRKKKRARENSDLEEVARLESELYHWRRMIKTDGYDDQSEPYADESGYETTEYEVQPYNNITSRNWEKPQSPGRFSINKSAVSTTQPEKEEENNYTGLKIAGGIALGAAALFAAVAFFGRDEEEERRNRRR